MNRTADRIIGGVTAILGVLILVIPVVIIPGINDLQLQNEIIMSLLVGAVLGVPLIVSGIALLQKHHRLAFYTALSTGGVYIAIPLLLQLQAFISYAPGLLVILLSAFPVVLRRL
jgi:hypothetical protein